MCIETLVVNLNQHLCIIFQLGNIFTFSPIGLQNWEEFSFTVDKSNNDGAVACHHVDGLRQKYRLGEECKLFNDGKGRREKEVGGGA